MDHVRIFVVDDSIAARTMLIRMLETVEDFEVVGQEGTGQASIIMLDEVNPDVVMLEASVSGGMKITDVVKEIKKIKPEVKIILCADSSSAANVIPAAESGADDFINKPYRKELIVRSIRECINR